jgi:hypothetical protein
LEVSYSRQFKFKGIAAAALAGTLPGCATMPLPPATTHNPTTQEQVFTTVSGLPHNVTITVPYDDTCSRFPRYAKTYIGTFRAGYVGEWNTQLGFLENKAKDPAKKKALEGSYLKPLDPEPTDTTQMGLTESNCLGLANSGAEEGRLKARNDLLSNPPVP